MARPSRTPIQPAPVESTPLITKSRWASEDFQVAGGLCMIQESTGMVVVVYDTATKRYFLPRGRKDVGEHLYDAAMREGFEESGFRPKPLPLLLTHLQPRGPALKQVIKNDPNALENYLATSEAIYITTTPVSPRHHGKPPGQTITPGYEYVCFWYAASVEPNAVWEPNTGMSDEKTYEGKLFTYEEALKVLSDPEDWVLYKTHQTWRYTKEAFEEKNKARPNTNGPESH